MKDENGMDIDTARPDYGPAGEKRSSVVAGLARRSQSRGRIAGRLWQMIAQLRELHVVSIDGWRDAALDLGRTEAEVDDLRAVLSQSEAGRQAAEAECRRLREEVSRLQATAAEATRFANEAAGQVGEAEGRLKAMQERLDARDAEVERLRAEVAARPHLLRDLPQESPEPTFPAMGVVRLGPVS